MKKIKRVMISGVLSACLVLSLSGCTTYNNFKAAFFPGDEVAREQTVKIGIYESLSGKNNAQGKEEVIGIELAHDLYGTVLGKEVELIYADNQSDMYVGETVIQELISQSPSVILGSCGETVTLVASDYIKAANIPAITISSTNPLITANNDYYFSATFTETRQGDALADFAYSSQNKDVVATVKAANDDAATATIKRFTNRIKNLTQNSQSVAGNFTLPQEGTDYTELIEKIRSSGAKAVFLDLPPEMAQLFLEQAIELKMTHILYLGDRTWNDEDFLNFVKSHSKLEVAYPSDFSEDANTTATSDIFLEAYKNKYGPDAEPSVASAIGFDAYLMAVQAIQNAYSAAMDTTEEDLKELYDSEATLRAAMEELKNTKDTGIPSGRQIQAALLAVDDFQGASGVISYDGQNEANKTITINHISGAIELPVYTVN